MSWIPRARPFLVGVAALVLGVSALVGPAGPARAEEAVSDTTRPTMFQKSTTSNGIVVEINSLSPRIITSENELVVSGTMTNASARNLRTPGIFVSVAHSTPLSVEELTADLDVETSPGSLVSATNLDTDLDTDKSKAFEVRIPVSSLPFDEEDEWGPRVITVEVASSGVSGEDRSIVMWDSGLDVAPTTVNALVPWTSQNAADDNASTDALVRIAKIPGATLAMDAAVLTSRPPMKVPATTGAQNQGAGANAPQSGSPQSGDEGQSEQTGQSDDAQSSGPTSILIPDPVVSKVMAAMSEVVALPEADVDLGALALIGDADLSARAQTSLDAFPRTPARATVLAAQHLESLGKNVAAAPTGAEAQSAEGASARSAALTVITDVVWPSADTFGTTQLATYSDRTTIAPVGSLAPAEDLDFTSLACVSVSTATGETSTNGPTETTANVLSQNAPIVELLGWSTLERADVLDAEQALSAMTALITRERPSTSRTVFAAVPRTTQVDAALEGRIDALMSPRWVRGVSFSQMKDSEATDIERAVVGPGALPTDTSNALTTVRSALSSLEPFAQATSNPKAVMASVEDGILSSLSATATPDLQLTRASQLSARVSSIRSQVAIAPSQAINLINKSASFPVAVRNSMAWDIGVTVTLVPSDPRLRVVQVGSGTVPADSVATIEVPVTAIGSGDIEVKYRLSTSTGAVLEDSQKVLVRMRAGWEDAITAVFMGAVGLLFLAGLTRTIRKRIRADRGAPTLESR